jgi:hypothetical protein
MVALSPAIESVPCGDAFSDSLFTIHDLRPLIYSRLYIVVMIEAMMRFLIAAFSVLLFASFCPAQSTTASAQSLSITSRDGTRIVLE